jgi:hypothetical protein
VESLICSIAIDAPHRIEARLGQIDAEIADQLMDVLGVTQFVESTLLAATLVQAIADHGHKI